MNIKDIDIDNEQFKNALDLVQFTRQSVFLTGKAGTGKSTFLKYVCATTKKEFVVLAPTGIAAINAEGQTLHSFFHIPFFPIVPDDSRFETPRRLRDYLKYNKEHVKLIRNLDLVIIDEISMVRADIIDFIDKILRTYTGNFREPFGGKQMLFVGDVYQLEPVVPRDEKDIIARFYQTPHFFSARVFQEIQLVSIELTKVYRQTDNVFVGVLDHIRTNTCSAADLQLLNTCVGQDVSGESGMFVTLAPRRDVVDHINETNLNGLEGDSVHFFGEIKGDFPESSLPTSKDLELKVGAQIIFIKNDMDKRWVNGTIGTIVGIDEEQYKYLHIITEDGSMYDVERDKWANVRYTYNEQERKIDEEELGTFTQFPVRLAWAITIHKSQGLTFNRAAIDFTGGVFAGGQTYVALSRCRSLEGLQLKAPINMSDIFVNPQVVQFASGFNNQNMVERALKRASADIEYNDCIKAFDAGNFGSCLDHFIKAIHARYDIEKPWALRYIRRKLGIINDLKQMVSDLRQQIEQKDAQLADIQHVMNEYAEEYYKLAHECLKLDDRKAAIKNLDKAIRMNPRYVDAMSLKGKTQMQMGKYNEALKTLREALEIIPLHFNSLYLHGKTLFKLQQYDLAKADIDRCLSINAESIAAHQLMGDIYDKLDDEQNAALHWAIAERYRKKPPPTSPRGGRQ